MTVQPSITFTAGSNMKIANQIEWLTRELEITQRQGTDYLDKLSQQVKVTQRQEEDQARFIKAQNEKIAKHLTQVLIV